MLRSKGSCCCYFRFFYYKSSLLFFILGSVEDQNKWNGKASLLVSNAQITCHDWPYLHQNMFYFKLEGSLKNRMEVKITGLHALLKAIN